MGNPRLKSLASLKRAIREGRKYASETENLKDPDEVSVPAQKTEQVMDQADYNIPTDGVKNTDNMGEARVLDEVTPLDSTLTAEDSEISAEKKAPVEETEQEVSLEKGASFVNKIQQTITNMKSKKVAKTQNVAADIALTPDILSKVASVMVATEKGQQLALQALEDQRAEAVKLATLNELIQANEDYEAQRSLQTKVASVHESSFSDLAEFIGDDPQMLEYAKYAYAAGAQDAAMAAETGALPPTEAAPAGDPAAEQDEIMQAISMLLQSGQIDEAGAQQLAEMAAQAAMSDQNPELSDEELLMALEQAVQAGLITPEAIQQILGGAAPMAPEAGIPAAPTAPEAGMPTEAGADAAAVPQEAPADAAKTASAVIMTTAMLKKAAVDEGIVAEEESEITPEDVATVLEAAVESGELSEEDAAAVEEEIVAAALADAEGVVDAEGVPEDAIFATDGSDWDVDGEALAQALEEEGITPEEFGQALEELGLVGPNASAEVEAEDEGLGDISEEELAAALAEEGVTEEELAQAIAEIEAEEAGAGEEALELEGSEGDDPETEVIEEE